MSKSRHHQEKEITREGVLIELWDSFWNPPLETCPKCGHKITVFYDPFFFAPIRTLKGKRRIQCLSCHFIWRPSRRRRSVWDKFRPFM
jgi:DNA-directed RNA polymerase subunit RPC12/RpoP